MSNNVEQIIQKTEAYVRKKLQGESSGHDWWHIHRVWQNAIYIAKRERADLLIVELAALLHDIADWKFHGGDDSVGPKLARKWLEEQLLEEDSIAHVCEIIKDLSFKGANVASNMRSKEGQVVQDADRLDAIGAIGIARAFAYGGYAKSEMYDPEKKPILHNSFEEYKQKKSTTVNHFYEKLLLLKDLMNTQAAKEIAEQRHDFMELFLQKFYEECNLPFP